MRIVWMIVLLILVLIAIKLAAKPSSWYWLTKPQEDAKAVTGSMLGKSNQTIDFKVRIPGENQLMPGEFIVPKKTRDTKQENESTAVKRVEKYDLRSIASIDAEILESVKDNTLGVRVHELDAQFYVLAKARDTSLADLERAARDDVTFTILMLEPQRFRGKLITIDGEAKRIWGFSACENAHGIPRLYDVWILTPDSGNKLYRVVCTSIPQDIPQGKRLDKPVRVRATGYFFKRQGYAAEKGLQVAPLLLAQRLRWFPPQRTETEDLGFSPYVLGVVILFGAALGITLWRSTVSDKRFRQNHLKRIISAPQEAITFLDGVAITETRDFVWEIADKDSSKPNDADIDENGKRQDSNCANPADEVKK